MNSRIINLLTEIAKLNPPCANTRIVAALVKRGRIEYVGYNRYKTHPLQLQYGKCKEAIYLHAEIDCLRKAGKRAKGMDMVIVRIKANGDLGLAKPCEGCARAIKFFGIKNTYWSVM